ncbi:MAG: response regulator [Planctomycetes bacterium]|nr:response regulator [Planctomycetota bacterium]
MAQKILMVDDDEGFLLAAGSLLEAAGYDVTQAESAAQARERLASERPDLIVLDVLMPGEDGFTFADNISKDERLAQIPVVLVTAVAESPGQMMYAFERDKGLTAADVLPKSEAHERLVDTVAAVLKDKER